MIKYWNMIHYHVFKWQQKSYELLDIINPLTWFFKIPTIQKFYARRGIDDMNKFGKEQILNHTDNGINIIWTGIHMGGLIILVEYGLFNFIQGLISESLIQFFWSDTSSIVFFILLLLVPSGLINYFLLFKDQRYLSYFEKFSKLPKDRMQHYRQVSFFSILLILLFFFSKFYFGY